MLRLSGSVESSRQKPSWNGPGECSNTSTASTWPESDTEANQALGEFIDVHQDHPLIEFDKLTEALLEWGDEIFAFHDTNRVTNGRIEGTNNKLGVLKRVAYRFVNTTNFAARALLLTPGMATSP